MTQLVLPKLSQTGANEFADVEDNDVAIREVLNGGIENDNLSGAAAITAANLAEQVLKLAVTGTKRVIAIGDGSTHVNYPGTAVSTNLEVTHGLGVEPLAIFFGTATDIGARTSDYTVLAKSKTKFTVRGTVSAAFGGSTDVYLFWIAIG